MFRELHEVLVKSSALACILVSTLSVAATGAQNLFVIVSKHIFPV